MSLDDRDYIFYTLNIAVVFVGLVIVVVVVSLYFSFFYLMLRRSSIIMNKVRIVYLH